MAEGTIGGTAISDLPESSFAYCEPGDAAVSTRCHFPIRGKDGKADPAHVRNALARLSGSPFEAKARPAVEKAARELNIGEPASKALGELKAEPLDTARLERWLKGEIPRRILAVPFGGPIPSPRTPLGVDIDGEFFSSRTDLFGGHKALMATRQRIVDWHHDMDPTGTMKGALLGHLVLDDAPESDGLWADFWANAGERRLALVKRLEERGAKLYGSSQSAYKKADPETGELLIWPMIREAISTSPQNTLAVMPPLKALIDDPHLDEMPADAIAALLVGLGSLGDSLSLPSDATGAAAAKAGRVLSAKNEAALRAALDALEGVLGSLDGSAAAST